MDRTIIETNRKHLAAIPRWITEEDYERSRSGYGCPRRLLPVLNRPIDDEPIYTDLIADAAARMGGSLDYLEIGVSVGKNFYVLANVLRDSRLTGFDWERINPTLERQLTPVSADGAVTAYRYGTNLLRYVQGDVFDDAAWCALAGRRFNIIFSDACHQGYALLHEFEKLEALDLIDPERVFMLWDDLDADPDGPVSRAFWTIAARLQRRLHLDDAGMFMLRVNGWFGQHEHRHTVGIINNIGVTRDSY